MKIYNHYSYMIVLTPFLRKMKVMDLINLLGKMYPNKKKMLSRKRSNYDHIIIYFYFC